MDHLAYDGASVENLPGHVHVMFVGGRLSGVEWSGYGGLVGAIDFVKWDGER